MCSLTVSYTLILQILYASLFYDARDIHGPYDEEYELYNKSDIEEVWNSIIRYPVLYTIGKSLEYGDCDDKAMWYTAWLKVLLPGIPVVYVECTQIVGGHAFIGIVTSDGDVMWKLGSPNNCQQIMFVKY